MGKINYQQFYNHKLEKIKILESKNYKELETIQQSYEAKIRLYKEQKDNIGTKIRMLEVYQNLWEDTETQIGGQAFLNEEFWNNITFNIMKYNKFMQELNENDYNKKIKSALDKKVNKELWDDRQQIFGLMKNDVNQMYSNFNKMHSEIHQRSLLQRECIEKHIHIMEIKYKEVEVEKEKYRSIFHEIQKDIGTKGNKISRQALENYKISIMEKAKYTEVGSEIEELDLAW